MAATARGTELVERVALLAGIPMFGSLDPAELQELAARFRELSYRRGDTLFCEGDEGGDFIVVAHGELEIVGGGAEPQVVNRLGPGCHLGEVALLLGGRRTATVRVSRPARLLALDGAEFRRLTERNAKLVTCIARDLSQQLDARTRAEVPCRSTLTIGVCGEDGLRGKTLVAHCLAALLRRQVGMEVALIGFTEQAPSSDAELLLDGYDGFARRLERDADLAVLSLSELAEDAPRRLTALIEALNPRYPLVVLDFGQLGAIAGEVCDVVVELVARSDAGRGDGHLSRTRVLRVVDLHNGASARPPINRCEPFVLPEDPSLRRLEPAAAALYLLEHPRSPAALVLERLARKVRGASIGVALAGGAAFGLAHIGVLKTLEDAGIPIDLLAGTSMGSIVGAAYAAGLSAEELVARAGRFGTKRKALSVIDPTVARPGLLAGNRLKAVLAELGITGTFEDLVLPFRATATDIESGEQVWIGTGSLADACRASASIPAVFAPVRRDGRALVDGAVVDQVPVELVRDMGADVCIAVMVIPTLRKGVRTVFSRVSDRVNAVNPLSYLVGSRGMPTMLDVVMNALQLLQYQLGSFEANAADARIDVDTSDFTWVDFHRAAPLIEHGVDATRRMLPQLERMLAERPALAG